MPLTWNPGCVYLCNLLKCSASLEYYFKPFAFTNMIISYILSHLVHHLRDHYEFTNDQLPVGLIAQLVRALHRYRRGHGFESCSSLNFFRFFFYQLLKLISITARVIIISLFHPQFTHLIISYLLYYYRKYYSIPFILIVTL